MNQLAVVEELNEVAVKGKVEGLLESYKRSRTELETIKPFLDQHAGVISWFLAGAKPTDGSYHVPSIVQIFNEKAALAEMNSSFWSRAIRDTGIYEIMAQARRSSWDAAIRDRTTPDFTEEAVRPTIEEILFNADKIFAERVDGLFRGLSRSHVTNRPEGFSKRMIIEYAYTSNYGPGYPRSEISGLINDLRKVISKFMGTESVAHTTNSYYAMEIAMSRRGEWISIDGGALRMRAYLKGTIHFEVHEQIAWRLNAILANLYPAAIPSQFRTKPAKKLKEFTLINGLIPTAVLRELRDFLDLSRRESAHYIKVLMNIDGDKAVHQRATDVLESIGGVYDATTRLMQFDYPVHAVIQDILISRTLPDKKSHQYYPTPPRVVGLIRDMANIEHGMDVLEPSAGQGALADIAKQQGAHVSCVEISELHVNILQAKGHAVSRTDFLSMNPCKSYDRVIMNPPFSEGRWKAHVEHAAKFLEDTGELYAVLPASAKDKDLFAGYDHIWSDPIHKAFEDTSISVVILKLTRA